MESVSLPISAQELKQSNELTRASNVPGKLDYDTYRQYLLRLGHVKRAYCGTASNIPPLPQNSYLQYNEGDRSDGRTDFRADQALWTQDDLPEIIYAFDRPANWFERHSLAEPPYKQYDIYGARLRDVPILPDHVSNKLEGWRTEAWMRFDPRVSLMDLIDRMPPDKRPASKSVIQMRTLRFREECKVLGWVALGKNYEIRRNEMLHEMAARQIDPALNSTRGISWGLINTNLGEAGGRNAVPDTRRVQNTVDLTGACGIPIQNSVVADLRATSDSSSSPSNLSAVVGDDGDHDFHFETDFESSGENDEDDDDEDEDDGEYLDSSPSTKVKRTRRLVHRAEENIRPRPSTILTRSANRSVNRERHAPRLSPSVKDAEGPKGLVVSYAGQTLTLKTPAERRRDANFVTHLQQQWHPFGSEGRRLQLAYLLDPAKLMGGFVDNRGFWQPAGADYGCIAADIKYG